MKEEFLKNILKDKKEQLMGIALDLAYWTDAIAGMKNEDELRIELEKARTNVSYSKKGKPKIKPDADKVNELSAEIQKITKAKAQLLKLDGMTELIEAYMVYIQKPSKELSDKLTAIEKL